MSEIIIGIFRNKNNWYVVFSSQINFIEYNKKYPDFPEDGGKWKEFKTLHVSAL